MNENELIDAAVSTGESTNCNEREGVYIYTFDSFQLEQFAQRIRAAALREASDALKNRANRMKLIKSKLQIVGCAMELLNMAEGEL